MSILIKKHHTTPEVKNIRILAWIRLFISLASASIMTIWALYINSFVNNASTTGFVSSLLTLIAFISFFVFIHLIEKSDKGNLYLLSLFLTIIAYILFTFINSFTFFLITAICLTAVQAIQLTTSGVIIRDSSKKSSLAKNEGLLFTFGNLGFVIGPLIAGWLATKYSMSYIFLISSLFVIIALIISIYGQIKDPHIQKSRDGIIPNLINFFKNKERVFAYVIAGGVQFWWVLIYLFMPLLIIEKGLSKAIVGYFLFAVALPLILTEYNFSKYPKKYSFKKIFMLGFIIPAILSIICFFIINIYTIMLVLTIASFGLALLEPTTEAYFLTIIKKNETSKFYGPFNTTFTINQFVAKIIPSALLTFLPFKFIFLVFGIFMFLFFLIAAKISK